MLMRQKDYAEHRGVTPQYIANLVRKGRLTPIVQQGVKLYDRDACDAILDKTADPAKQAGGAHAVYDNQPHRKPQGDLGMEPEITGELTFANAKTRREHWAAQSAELKARRDAGDLLEVSTVSRMVSQIIGDFWSGLDEMDNRLPLRLAGKDAREIKALMADERHKLRCQMAEKLQKLLIELGEDAPSADQAEEAKDTQDGSN
ncbi:MAG: hypothetical protein Alpg2KO_33700 [Alphaproteobacteria bacterium]